MYVMTIKKHMYQLNSVQRYAQFFSFQIILITSVTSSTGLMLSDNICNVYLIIDIF